MAERGTRGFLESKGYSEDVLRRAFPYLRIGERLYREDYKVVIPYRDGNGALTGFYGRLIGEPIEAESEHDMYKSLTAWSMKNTPFLMYLARGTDRLIAVEGFFDALVCYHRGLKGVIAICGPVLRKAHLLQAGNHIVLAFNNDSTRRTRIEMALKLVSRMRMSASVVMIPKPYRSPDELIRRRGIQEFTNLVDQALQSGKWLANRSR